MKPSLKNILAALFIALVFISIGFVFGITYSKLKGDKVQTIYNLIKSEYEGDLDQEALSENLIKGLGDKYSYYLNKETYQKAQSEDQGKYVGLGMIYSFENGIIKILEVFENTPASSAGLSVGDFIVKINGIEVTTLKNRDEARNLFKVKEGENINLSLQSKDKKEKSVKVKTAILELPSLKLEKMNNDIYYLKIFRFQENTPKEFEEKFKNVSPEDLQKIIIDLRNNFGGNTEVALLIDKQFIEKGLLLREVYKDGEEIISEASGFAKYKNTNIAVLVNKNTTSAAEQMAGALKDSNRAKIIGEPTYGKSVFGNTFKLQDGSAIFITIGHWLRSNGETVGNGGVKPDIEVQDMTDENQDHILDRAIEYLDNEN